MKFLYTILIILFFVSTDVYSTNEKIINDTISYTQDSLYHKTQLLDSVVVIGNNTTHYADRDIIHITRSMRRGARNTAQMLGNIPGIDCDYSNNSLTYYGSKNILILVDSIEKAADYIKELHHLRFNKVEIVQNPSGKYANYDLLINLHTKHDYEGYEGNFFEQVSMLPTDGNGKGKYLSGNYSSASFTYTKNKWNFVGRYNFRYLQNENDNIDKITMNNVNALQEKYLHPMRTHFFRIHNAYVAIDYQFNKKHSVSVSYNYSTDATDDYISSEIERLWLENNKTDLISRKQESDVNSTRHTLGLYYRGRSGTWNYTYDFNFINDGWYYDRNYIQSTGYSSDIHQHNRMNYIWSKSEINRRFLDDRLYISAGYNFTLKDYIQKDKYTGYIQSKNNYNRNEFWTWISYRFKQGTDLNFSASAEHVNTESPNYKDDNMVYKLSGMFYHRWNKWLWMRINYSGNIKHPQLDQVTEYGYFTDSLNWKSGNPALRTQVYHSGKIWLDFFNLFNFQAGFNYSPNMFSTIIDIGEGTLPSSKYGRYTTYIPQNTKYRDFWISFYIYKRIKDLTFAGSILYENKHAEYEKYKNSDNGFRGTLIAKYYNNKHKLAFQTTYNLNNSFSVSPQGMSIREHDYLVLYIGKDMFKQRLNAGIQYVSPHIFRKGYSENIIQSDALSSIDYVNVNKTMAHSIMLSLTYRLQGGKSVRQYNRSMSEEK